MNCPHCGAAYEEIYTIGEVAPVAVIATCMCDTANTSAPRTDPLGYGRNFSFNTTAPTTVIEPAPALRPTEEIVADMLDLLDELEDD